MLRRIKPAQVTKGMYVHAFEGSWFSHPFWRSRFVLDSEDDVAKVRDSAIDFVVIDIGKGRDVVGAAPAPVAANAAARAQVRTRQIAAHMVSSAKAASVAPAGVGGPTRTAPNGLTPLERERQQAVEVVDRSKAVMRGVFDGVRLGKAIRSADVVSVVDEISSSLDRNRTMLMRVTRLKSKHEYTYLHSVAVCTLMVNLARELGLDDATVRRMGLAGLLHDVGKMAVDDAILDKPGRLTDAEFAEIRHHTTRGHAMLEAGEEVPAEALDVCLHHHEKVDGTGYPFGLEGDQISLAARMGGICDVYDAITSARAYKDAWSPLDGITAMTKWEGHFDRELLFRFMKSVGVYHVGLVVRLTTGRVAVVLDNGQRLTRTKLRVFHADGAFVEPHDIILSDQPCSEQVAEQIDPHGFGFFDWPTKLKKLIAGERIEPRGPAAAAG